MGTPEKKQARQRNLVAPAVTEKFRLLVIGKEIGQFIDLKRLPDVLEVAKDVLCAIVSGLDKPIFPDTKYINYPVPEKFLRKRGVRLFESWIITIWLQRSGKWFLCFRDSNNPQAIFQEADSWQLAEILFQRAETLLKKSFRGKEILEELSFLEDIVLYNVLVLGLLSHFFKSVKELLKKREEHLRLMGEWLNLFDDFNHSLDPLTGWGREVLMKGYSIWEEGERGTRPCTNDYLCPEALEPLWKIFRKGPASLKREEHVIEYRFRSLENLLQRLSWIFEDIEQAKSRVVGSSFVSSNDRLDFTEGEIAVLKELVDSIVPATAV